MRKLALLWVLIRNGTLLQGSILFWDEPEANLNPRIIKTAVEILLELQRLGVQIFIATHDYVTVKEFDLQTKKKDQVVYHSLFRDLETQQIRLQSSDSYLRLNSNSIADTFGDLYDQDTRFSGKPFR
jgi:ABC-type multidrug transport system ATPase subunit